MTFYKIRCKGTKKNAHVQIYVRFFVKMVTLSR